MTDRHGPSADLFVFVALSTGVDQTPLDVGINIDWLFCSKLVVATYEFE